MVKTLANLGVFQPIKQFDAVSLARIVEPLQILLADLVNTIKILLFQVTPECPEILLDVVHMRALGNDAVTPAHSPYQSHLGSGAAVLSCDG